MQPKDRVITRHGPGEIVALDIQINDSRTWRVQLDDPFHLSLFMRTRHERNGYLTFSERDLRLE